MILRDQNPQPAMAIKFHGGRILRVANTIGVENQDVARVENIAFLIIRSILEHPQGKSSERNSFAPTAVIQEWLLLSRIGNAQFVPPAVPSRKTKRHEAPFDAALPKKSVYRAQHFCWRIFLRTQTPQRANGDSAIKRRSASLPTDVSHGDRQLLWTVAQKIVEVATQLTRRNHARSDIQPKLRPGQSRQQRALNA